MDDIEETCERIIVLDNGKIKFDDSIDVLKKDDTKFKDIVRSLMNDEEKV